MKKEKSLQLEIKHFEPKLPIDEIDLSEDNVRISRQKTGLKDLKENIEKFGLFQPVTVFAKGSSYKLLVGQRRLLACRELDWDTIPAFIIKPMNAKTRTIISFGENVHRRKLPYEDSIQACDKLYAEYTGTKKSRVEQISKDLGITEYLVGKFLAHKLIPRQVRDYVSEGKLSEDIAHRITSAHFPDTEKIIEIATDACRMTSEEAERTAEYGKRNPKASAKDILDYAKNPPPVIELIIHIEPDTNTRIKENSTRKKISIERYVKDAIERQLEEDE